VTVDHVVPKDVEIDIPRIIAVTPAEKAFIDSKAYADAPMRGRIVPSRSKRALSFDDGQDYVPTTPDMAADAAPYVGDFGLCSRIAGDEEHFHCVSTTARSSPFRRNRQWGPSHETRARIPGTRGRPGLARQPPSCSL